MPFNYFCYGAALSEVELDTLTGDFHLLRTDLCMDVGQSLNPAIDIGQVQALPSLRLPQQLVSVVRQISSGNWISQSRACSSARCFAVLIMSLGLCNCDHPCTAEHHMPVQ